VGITYGIRHLLYIKPTFVGFATITVSFLISKLRIDFSILRINKKLLLLITMNGNAQKHRVLKSRNGVCKVPVLHPTN
jgi:hypothetical protein